MQVLYYVRATDLRAPCCFAGCPIRIYAGAAGRRPLAAFRRRGGLHLPVPPLTARQLGSLSRSVLAAQLMQPRRTAREPRRGRDRHAAARRGYIGNRLG